jgi:polyisoprenoid-binding protein YceI
VRWARAVQVSCNELDFVREIELLKRGCFGVVCLAGAFALACPTMQGQQQKLILDTEKSEVHFKLTDTLHIVNGTFHVQQGEVNFNPADGVASGTVVVDALSGKSGNSTRDHRMTKEELKAEDYKTISFAPTKFTGTFKANGDSTLQVHGLFTLLGTGHEIDVPMQVQVNGGQVYAVGTFTVPFVQWGMKDPSMFAIKVNKEVQIDLSLMGSLK